jgi:hypothetical protein
MAGCGQTTGTTPPGPAVIATSTDGIRSLAADEKSAYFTTVSIATDAGGAVMSAALVNGGAPVKLSDALGESYAIVVDATHVYWTAFDFPSSEGGTVANVPIGGGAITTLASGQSLWGGAQLAKDAKSLYYSVYAGAGEAIVSVPLAGGTPTTVIGSGADAALTTDGTYVYYSDQSGNISRVPVAGGTPTLIHQDPHYAATLATDGVNLYWLSHDDATTGSVTQMPAGGGPTIVLAGPYSNPPAGLAIDRQYVYWTANNAILRVPIGGGAVTTVESLALRGDAVWPGLLAVTDRSVVWVDTGGDAGAQRILTAPK